MPSTHGFDVVVVGSGMGGMTTATALSRMGHRVLLLEQAQSIGGLTHSFSREGFTWDVGLHYCGTFGHDQPAGFRSKFPALDPFVVYRELGTPLATAAFTGHEKGGFYGVETTPRRILSDALNAKTPVPGLFLTGQDVMTPGIAGAFVGRHARRRRH